MISNLKEDWDEHYKGNGVNSAAPNKWKYVLSQLEWCQDIALNKKPKLNILDVGCGLAVGSQLIKLLFPWHYRFFGVDFSGPAIDRINKLVPKIDSPGNFTVANIPPLNFEDNFFDVIIMTECLEHIEEPRQLLTEIKRVTKNKGKVFISVPNNCGGGTKWGEGEAYEGTYMGKCPHFWCWDETLLTNLLNEIGFNILHMKKVIDSQGVLVAVIEVLK